MNARLPGTLSCLLLLALISLPAKALQAAAADAGQPSQALLQQKLDLMQRMLENSSSSRRISSQGNDLAKQRISHARDHLNVARQALQSNQLKDAADRLEQAMTFYSSAASEVADATDRGDAQRTRFNELSVSIESFRLYVQKALVQSDEPSPLDPIQLSNLMQLAAQLGQHQNYGEANDVLNEAYMLTITAVSALKGGTTIVYSNEFETPEQQFEYELERYRGLLQLFKMVIPEGKLPSKYSWTEKSVGVSNKAYKRAVKLAGNAEYPQALEQIDEASKKLTQVLRLLGLPIS